MFGRTTAISTFGMSRGIFRIPTSTTHVQRCTTRLTLASQLARYKERKFCKPYRQAKPYVASLATANEHVMSYVHLGIICTANHL